ncbi:hypothetical protein ABIF69_001129 [Bradyrhizobium japonicum]
MQLRQLCVDIGLFRKCCFQLSSQREHVNRLEPVPCSGDSLISRSLAVAEIEQVQCHAAGSPDTVVNLILLPLQPSGRLACEDSRSFHFRRFLLFLGSAAALFHVLAGDTGISGEIRIRDPGLLPAR